jgi:hypothetical protein
MRRYSCTQPSIFAKEFAFHIFQAVPFAPFADSDRDQASGVGTVIA